MIVLGMRTIRYQGYRLDQSVILYIGASYTTADHDIGGVHFALQLSC